MSRQPARLAEVFETLDTVVRVTSTLPVAFADDEVTRGTVDIALTASVRCTTLIAADALASRAPESERGRDFQFIAGFQIWVILHVGALAVCAHTSCPSLTSIVDRKADHRCAIGQAFARKRGGASDRALLGRSIHQASCRQRRLAAGHVCCETECGQTPAAGQVRLAGALKESNAHKRHGGGLLVAGCDVGGNCLGC